MDAALDELEPGALAQLLVLTPSPKPLESLLGFALRTAEGNGYGRPGWLLDKKSRGHDLVRAALDPEKLAPGLGLISASMLKPLRYADEIGDPVLLGKPVGLGDLRLYSPHFCPTCVEELGYLEALWDCGAVIACPRHRTPLVGRCTRCKMPVAWERPGMLTCACGADLRESVQPATWSTDLCAELSGYIAAALRCSDPPGPAFGYPTALLELSLYDLLWLIRKLGRTHQIARGNRRRSTFSVIVENAAVALASWPYGLASHCMTKRSFAYSSAALRHRTRYINYIPDPVDQFLAEGRRQAGTPNGQGRRRHSNKVAGGIHE